MTTTQIEYVKMAISGTRTQTLTSKNKSLAVTDIPNVGQVKERTSGRAVWSDDPVNGLRLLSGAEAEQFKLESTWNLERNLKKLFNKITLKGDADRGRTLECLELTPAIGQPLTTCYDAETHLQVLQKGTAATPQSYLTPSGGDSQTAVAQGSTPTSRWQPPVEWARGRLATIVMEGDETMFKGRFRNCGHNRGIALHHGFRGGGMWGVLALFVSMIIAGGCGSSGGAAATNDAASNPDMNIVAIGTVVRGPAQPCTEPHTICVNATFATTMTTRPTLLRIDLFVDVPPTHPPDGNPLFIESPDLVAGETVQLRMADLNLTGTYHFLGAIYMPGGGSHIPVQAVDYTANSSGAYEITGAALNLSETLAFQLYQ